MDDHDELLARADRDIYALRDMANHTTGYINQDIARRSADTMEALRAAIAAIPEISPPCLDATALRVNYQGSEM